jgi:hypothetical protein
MDMYPEADGHDAVQLGRIRCALFVTALTVSSFRTLCGAFGDDDAALDLLNDQLPERTLPGGFSRNIPIRSEARAYL